MSRGGPPGRLAAATCGSSSSSRSGCMLLPAVDSPAAPASAGCSSGPRSTRSSSTATRSCSWPARDGRVVGRISAQIDHAYNDYHDNRWGMFGFLELEDDPEVGRRAARRRRGLAARARAATAWSGPMDFTMNDECGVLDRGLRPRPDDPAALAPAVLPARCCEGAGLEKAVDLLHVGARDRRPREVRPGDLRAGRAGEPEARDRRCAHDAAGTLRSDLDRLRRGLQRRVGAATGASSRTPRRTSTHYAPGAAARLRPRLVHGRRDADGRGRRRGDHRPRRQPGPAADERRPAAVRLVALPAQAPDSSTACRVGFLGVKPEYQHTGRRGALYVEHFDTPAATRGSSGARWAGSSRPTAR